MAKLRSNLVGKHVSIITTSDEHYWDCFIESAWKEQDFIFYRCILENGAVNNVSLETICNFFERKVAAPKLRAVKPKKRKHLTLLK